MLCRSAGRMDALLFIKKLLQQTTSPSNHKLLAFHFCTEYRVRCWSLSQVSCSSLFPSFYAKLGCPCPNSSSVLDTHTWDWWSIRFPCWWTISPTLPRFSVVHLKTCLAVQTALSVQSVLPTLTMWQLCASFAKNCDLRHRFRLQSYFCHVTFKATLIV